ncbi:hypothetical protein F5888DRAFT_1283011 [Russula emetica]|nr:hypothetical protein F5888DRAFT_1283011 [Russula emetica]
MKMRIWCVPFFLFSLSFGVRVLVSSRSALAFAELAPLSATPLQTSLALYLLSSPFPLSWTTIPSPSRYPSYTGGQNSRPAFSHLPTARGIGLVRILGKVESIFKELCCGLNARDFLHATQERFVNMLCYVWQAHFNSDPTGTLRPTNSEFLFS